MRVFLFAVLVVSLIRLGFKGYHGGTAGSGDDCASFIWSFATDLVFAGAALWLLF